VHSPEPATGRPNMPGYGIRRDSEGLLPWSWAEERLRDAHNYWVATTRPDGRPHVTAVWGIWHEGAFYFNSGEESRKARNLGANADCVVCPEQASEAVIVEGRAEAISDAGLSKELNKVYAAKYGDSPPGTYFAVKPETVFGFVEHETQFAATATRWRFG
jgi:nitroimidazol reductase NimA-like FMN-containing flavoprotein (pyridoxamine 5'-phosphate oxidase superfamily)